VATDTDIEEIEIGGVKRGGQGAGAEAAGAEAAGPSLACGGRDNDCDRLLLRLTKVASKVALVEVGVPPPPPPHLLLTLVAERSRA